MKPDESPMKSSAPLPDVPPKDWKARSRWFGEMAVKGLNATVLKEQAEAASKAPAPKK